MVYRTLRFGGASYPCQFGVELMRSKIHLTYQIQQFRALQSTKYKVNSACDIGHAEVLKLLLEKGLT